MGCADFKIGRRRTRGKMEALAVDENGTASQRISCPKGYPVGIGIHIHPVADQFQTASEVGIARIGDIDQSRSIRSPDSDGARPIELGMQVDGSAGRAREAPSLTRTIVALFGFTPIVAPPVKASVPSSTVRWARVFPAYPRASVPAPVLVRVVPAPHDIG